MLFATFALDDPAAVIDATVHLPSYVSTALQTASTILVAGLLVLLVRVIDRRFLRYWAYGWVCLAVGLIALDVSFWLPAASRPLLTIYWAAGDMFGFLLFVGCRDYVDDRPMTRRDIWLLIPPILLGIMLPRFVQRSENLHINEMFPAHAILFGGFCLLALSAMLRAKPTESQTLIGVRLMQVGLLCLVALFWHYAIVMGRTLHLQGRITPEPGYMQFSALYDSFFELALAFAQVLLATDSVRRQLSNLGDQLALAASTDVLTGLLNRRAFETMIADPQTAPAPGSLAAIDVNDLKPLNDRLGHAIGDAALRAVARSLQLRTRIGDPVFRMGGDEFLLMLPGVNAAELTQRMKNLDDALTNQRLPGADQPVNISVAWGVTEYTSNDLLAAVDRADAAMYSDKKARKQK